MSSKSFFPHESERNEKIMVKENMLQIQFFSQNKIIILVLDSKWNQGIA